MNKHTSTFAGILIVLLAITYHRVTSMGEETIKDISAQDLKMALDRRDDIVIINPLAQKYYKDCSIPGSVNIPLSPIEKFRSSILAQYKKNQKIITYCGSVDCSLGKQAAHELKSLGFTNVSMYSGGVKEWRKRGYPCEGTCRMDYLK